MIFAKDAPFSRQVDLLMRPGCRIHFGQFGEDILLPILFNEKRDGFYVDVGCHDPFVYSNTYILHNQYGWSGINIDASPKSIGQFKLYRPNDTNINVGVSTTKSTLEFYVFKDGAVNTFDKNKATQLTNEFGPFSVIEIDVEPLADILARNIGNRNIDYMNIDCEWLDYQVVQSNNWDQYRPRFLTVELHGMNPNNPMDNKIVSFLDQAGYGLHSFIAATGLFQRR